MAKTGITLTVRGEGIRETLRVLKVLPKDAQKELRVRTRELSVKLAARAKADGMKDSAPQSPDVATTVRAVTDRVPSITAGGTRRLGRNRAPAYKLLFGSLFGSNAYSQFHRPHAGQSAYWFFPVVEKNSADINRTWMQIADSIVRDFAAGGA